MRSRPIVITALLIVAVLLAALLYAVLRDGPVPVPPAAPTASPATAAGAVVIAAGDIARCNDDDEPEQGAVDTGALIEELLEQEDRETIVAALGDLAYNDGTEEEFANCYDPTWGPFRDQTRPAIGDHDNNTDGGGPFFEYFDDVDGLDMPEPEGWYSYALGQWHVIVLNTACGRAGCEDGEPQYEWLQEELEQVETRNILAYWHRPMYSAGHHGGYARVGALYELLDEAGADIVLSGNDHDYQRWAPQRADGTREEDAPRQFVVGTGGGTLRPIEQDGDNEALEYYQGDEHGVLRVVLESCGYSWEFINVDGEVLDEGTLEGTCEG